MSGLLTKEFIKGLPKAELHLHLEGSLEPELKLALAQKNQIDIGQATIEEVKASYEFDSLPSFLAIYYPAMNVLQTEDDFYDLATAYLKKAQEHHVLRAELFFDPQAHTSRGVSFETVINGYYRAIQDAHKFGIQADLIMCFLRDMSAESAEETFEQALPHLDKIIGVGLDSDEKGNPPSKFATVFEKAREKGLKLTMHCDIDQDNTVEHLRQVIEDIQVDRIDHGTNIVEAPELIDSIKTKGIGLTACPVSNGFVVEDMKGKEIKHLLDNDVKVTINSDDPAYFQSYISDDMYTLASHYNLTQEDIVKLAKNSFDIAWISEDERAAYKQKIDDYVKEYHQ